jgi:hypothetical protein
MSKKDDLNKYFKQREQLVNKISDYLKRQLPVEVKKKVKKMLDDVMFYQNDLHVEDNLKEVDQMIDRLVKSSVSQQLKIIEESHYKSYQMGYEFGGEELVSHGITPQAVFLINRHKHALLVAWNDDYKDILKRTRYMSEYTKDIVRGHVKTEVDTILMNGQPFDKSMRVLEKRITEEGLVIIDNAGKTWKHKTYSEMAIQTKTMNSFRHGAITRLRDEDEKYVYVSSHGYACPKCAELQGKVYFIDGSGRNHLNSAPLSDAISRGLFHPRCRHSTSAYVTDFYDEIETEELVRETNKSIEKLPEKESYKRSPLYGILKDF